MSIKDNFSFLINQLPKNTILVVAAKGREPSEVKEVIDAGARIIGENYAQESIRMMDALGVHANRVDWHFIGHLQRNKVRKVVPVHDMIETLDSFKLARKINNECERISKIMPVLIEVNSAGEQQKHGVFPDEVLSLAEKVCSLPRVNLKGLMTMGSVENPRPAFRITRNLFDKLAEEHPEITFLSMGMSASYNEALEEGANMVRIGTNVFEGKTEG